MTITKAQRAEWRRLCAVVADAHVTVQVRNCAKIDLYRAAPVMLDALDAAEAAKDSAIREAIAIEHARTCMEAGRADRAEADLAAALDRRCEAITTAACLADELGRAKAECAAPDNCTCVECCLRRACERLRDERDSAVKAAEAWKRRADEDERQLVSALKVLHEEQEKNRGPR